jgi:hypothetical protein
MMKAEIIFRGSGINGGNQYLVILNQLGALAGL